MTSRVSFFICLLAFSIVQIAKSCDILMRVKSNTTKLFAVQIIAPNGKNSGKQTLHKSERLIFQEKANECGVGPFQIKTFTTGADGKFSKEEHIVKVILKGVGMVNYEVGDDLLPKQQSRQGAVCEGDCAPLAATRPPRLTTTKATKL